MTPELKEMIRDRIHRGYSMKYPALSSIMDDIETMIDDAVGKAIVDAMEFGPLLDAVGLTIASKKQEAHNVQDFE